MRPAGLWAAVLLLGCLDSFPAPPAAQGDAALADAGRDGPPPDGPFPDAAPDAASRDAGSPDASPNDATADATTDPDASCGPERCNGLDDDCDGQVDEVPGVGEPCEVGLGACFRAGLQACDLALGEVACDAQPGESTDEICNGLDDDCDGAADEALGVGAPCLVGLGLCATAGVGACDADGGVVCVGVPGQAGSETCDGRDEDCDGLIDEGFGGVGDPCSVGEGTCQRDGLQVCDVQGELRCGVEPGPVADERCNGLDDDCDGRSDEGLGLGEACTAGVGLCARAGRLVCGPNEATTCDAVPGDPQPETCDDRDQDCDGERDNGFGLGEACFAGVGACTRLGNVTCDGCTAQPGAQAPEACNDLDDDCDGRIDEGATCVAAVVQGCRVWLGQADVHGVPAEPRPSWDGCPISDQDREGAVRCTSTGRDGYFYALPLVGDVDDNDVLGIALTCDPGLAWVQQHCEVFLAHADLGALEAVSLLDPGSCAAQVGPGAEPNPRCVRSGGDGLFHPMWLRGDVNADDVFGITFRCVDPERPDRAAGLQSGLAATIGWHFRAQGALFECAAGNPPYMNDVPEWGTCPRDGIETSGTRRCATGTREGGFRAFEIGDGRDVEECSALGIALRSR